MSIIKTFKGKKPDISQAAYIAPGVSIIGEVVMMKGSSLWFNTVLRGDVEKIFVGENTNIQDGVVIHTNYSMPAIIKENVTVGHRAVIHGCKVERNCLIGMGAVLLDGSSVGEFSVVAAGAVVQEGKTLEPGGVYAGVPAKKVKDITPSLEKVIKKRASEYKKLADIYSSEKDIDDA